MNSIKNTILQDIEFIKDALTGIGDSYTVTVTEPYAKKKDLILDVYIGHIPKEESNKPNRFDFPCEVRSLMGNKTIIYVDKVAEYHLNNYNLYVMISEFANRISDNFEIFDFYESTHGYISFKVIKI